MTGTGSYERDLVALVVRRVGRLEDTGDLWEPYRVVSPDGPVVDAVREYLNDLQAMGRSVATQRSYGMDLLRWFRFLWAVEVPWDQATMAEARDFCRWVQVGTKPAVTHWRCRGDGLPDDARLVVAVANSPNPMTGKTPPGPKYAAVTAAHAETVLRDFYRFHLDTGTGPMVNPFPLSRRRRQGRPGAHHNPMEPHLNERVGRYRPKLVSKPPHCIPDDAFNELFAKLGPHRDRALVAFWVSTGARASELLGARGEDVDPGQQLVTVIRKGSRAMQPLPASPGSFVWLRLYQVGLHGLVPAGRDDPLWWTLARPFRPLSYHAAYRMFSRASASLGANWSLHDLRHTAAYRMARDPGMPLTDVQWILGHARLGTTQIYVTAPFEEVVASILAHYARRSEAAAHRQLLRLATALSRSTCSSGGHRRERRSDCSLRRGARGERGRPPPARPARPFSAPRPVPSPTLPNVVAGHRSFPRPGAGAGASNTVRVRQPGLPRLGALRGTGRAGVARVAARAHLAGALGSLGC